MSEQLTLYYMPGSYYSQKAALPLLDRDIPYNHHYINLNGSEHLEPWFVRLNRAGQIPLLKDGDMLIAESENIINYIDKKFNTGPPLVLVGNEDYDKIHLLLTTKCPIEVLTYGTFINPDMSGLPKDLSQPPQAIIDNFKRIITRTREMATENEDLKIEYLKKSEDMKKFRDNSCDKDKVNQCIEALYPIFDELEAQLIKSEKDNPDNWLFNTTYTSADVTFTVLLNRVTYLGHAARYFTEDKRPHVFKYWQRVQKRKCFQDLLALVQQYKSRQQKLK